MRFDWLQFVKVRHINYVAAGPNTAKGNISIHCPFCGGADRSMHMGLSLNARQPFWGCFRNSRHRGRDPAHLVAKLLKVAYGTAQAIVDAAAPTLDEFEQAVERLRDQEEKQPERKSVVVVERPKEFRVLGANIENVFQERFVRYMATRGFGTDTRRLIEDYEFWYALTGTFAWRLIFPVRDQQQRLLGWTGRDIRPTAKIRYLTVEDLPKSAVLVFGGQPKPGDALVVCEGPFDALKLDFYGRRFGVRALATMGAANSPEKLPALASFRKQFARLVVVFDADAGAQAMGLADEIGAKFAYLPTGYKDPGELDRKAAEKFLQKIAG